MPGRLPALWRGLSRRAAALPLLLVGAALAALVALDPALGLARPDLTVPALMLSLLMLAAAAAFWQGEREARRVRRALAAGISHDMRTPLAQIRMFTEMMLMGRERSDEERIRWLETVEREAHRLGDVMENLLLFIHGEEADPFPVRQPTDLGALIEDVVAGFVPRARSLRTAIHADPPAGILAPVDPRAVRQVLVNLLDNALRYGPAGQTIVVTLTAGAAGQALITVTDGGPGIPAADRKRVWQPFVRLDGHAAAGDGSGLGLAVVRRVVEVHGGRAWIDDAAGGGARVSVGFPILAAAPATNVVPLPAPTAMPLPRAADPSTGQVSAGS